jgi:hypothetical protein
VRHYDTLWTSELVRVYDEVLRELYGPDYADQAETLRELGYVIRARTGHDVKCSALRGGFDCDCYKLTAARAEHAAEIWARRWIDHKCGSR